MKGVHLQRQDIYDLRLPNAPNRAFLAFRSNDRLYIAEYIPERTGGFTGHKLPSYMQGEDRLPEQVAWALGVDFVPTEVKEKKEISSRVFNVELRGKNPAGILGEERFWFCNKWFMDHESDLIGKRRCIMHFSLQPPEISVRLHTVSYTSSSHGCIVDGEHEDVDEASMKAAINTLPDNPSKIFYVWFS